MPPTNGTKEIKIHHPLRPMSWSLRTVTPSDGRSTAQRYSTINKREGLKLMPGATPPTATSTTMTREFINWKNQYSFRRARPSNTAYFFKTVKYQFMISSFRRESRFQAVNTFPEK